MQRDCGRQEITARWRDISPRQDWVSMFCRKWTDWSECGEEKFFCEYFEQRIGFAHAGV
jgi:hypothetical protein